MALPVSDNFNRAGVNPIDGNWATVPSSGMKIVSNQIVGTGSGLNASVWTADTFANDQYAELKLVTLSQYMGPLVRGTTTGTNYYCFAMAGSTSVQRMYKNVSGGFSQIGSDYSNSLSSGDVLKLEVSGTTLTPYINGSAKATRTDSALASGYAGAWAYTASAAGDDWAAGNVSAGGGGTLYHPYYRHLLQGEGL